MSDGSEFGKNVTRSGVDNSSSVHNDNSYRDILILSKSLTQGLDDTILTAEAQYSINFSGQQKKFCLSLHYIGNCSFLFVNIIRIHQFKAKKSKLNAYPLCLSNISKDFLVNKTKKLDCIDTRMIFQLIIIILVLTIF